MTALCRLEEPAGFLGRGKAKLGFGLLAFLMIAILSALYEQTQELPIAFSLFRGLQAAIAAIVAYAAVSFGKSYLNRPRPCST